MSLPTSFLSIIPNLISKGVDLIDKKFPSSVEKQRAIQDYELQVKDQIESAWKSEQENITARHANDMKSDSWLSKNIRPLALVYLMGLFTLAFFINVPETVLEMLSSLLTTCFVFYFGFRTSEKVTKMIKG